MYQKSKRLKWYSKKFTKYVYNFFDLIIVPSNSIEILFKDFLNKDKILKIDDTRYEQVLNRKNQSNGIEIFENQTLTEVKKNLLISSTKINKVIDKVLSNGRG